MNMKKRITISVDWDVIENVLESSKKERLSISAFINRKLSQVSGENNDRKSP